MRKRNRKFELTRRLGRAFGLEAVVARWASVEAMEAMKMRR